MRKFLGFLLITGIAAAVILRIGYGGGDSYPDLSTPAQFASSALEEVLHYPEPIGDLAISDDGRLFFTVHPESRPSGNKLLEWVAGAAVPYPRGADQPFLFDTVFGITIDKQQNLWSIDHGEHGFAQPRLLAFNLHTGKLVHDFKIPADIAPGGSFLRDLIVSADGRYVVISDSSTWRKKPALIVYNIASGHARRVLESHESVMAENYLIQNEIRNLSFFGGLLTLKYGVSGIAIDEQNEWLYYAAMNHSNLYRIPMHALTDATLPRDRLAKTVQLFSKKPLSEGIDTDRVGNIFVTDIEHNSVSIVDSKRLPETLLQSASIRWASAVSVGPDNYLYIADSAFPELAFATTEHIKTSGPYTIFRLKLRPSANQNH